MYGSSNSSRFNPETCDKALNKTSLNNLGKLQAGILSKQAQSARLKAAALKEQEEVEEIQIEIGEELDI